jgi:aspartyl-tRNA(Asn)/glutamyl-tRNA(Gln) amidotransferase subunit B
LALGCDITLRTGWDRKSYFYADLPNGYQITQFYAPICTGGGFDVGGRFINLDHIHLEEDAGKLIHDNLRDTTRMDFNRGGVPLIEIVTKPDMRSAGEAAAFVEKVRLALIYAGVCDGRMEQGRLRVDANVSVMPEGSDTLGTRVEVKNLNSFRNVARAIEYEARRQIRALGEGEALRQETRRFIDANGETEAMREKETAADYRYYPDSDIPDLVLDKAYIDGLRASLPEAPAARRARYAGAHGMTESDADTVLARKDVSDFYDGIVSLGADPKEALGVVRGEILRNIGSGGDAVGVRPEDAARLLKMKADGEIGAGNMKKAIGILMRDGRKNLDEVIESENMLVREDPDMLASAVRDALAANPAAVASYKAGEAKVFGFLMGQCDKILKGAVRPKTLRDELRSQLDLM